MEIEAMNLVQLTYQFNHIFLSTLHGSFCYSEDRGIWFPETLAYSCYSTADGSGFYNPVSGATLRVFPTPVVARAAAGSSAVVIGLSQ